MAKKEKIYTRLRGKKKGLVGIQSLWMGPDHLLLIDSKRVSEDYKRFYYEDIQALIVGKTHRGKFLNLLMGLGMLTMGLWALQTDDTIGRTILWIISAAMLGGCLFNLFSGPTCTCNIMTAVQTETLLSLNRVKNAERVIEQLRPRIENTQGRIKDNAHAAPMPPPVQSLPIHEKSGTMGKRHEKGMVHWVLFYLLWADAAFTSVSFLGNHISITLANNAIALAMAALVIIAIVKQHDSTMPKGIKTTTWTTLFYVCTSFIVGYGIYIASLIQNPELMRNQNQWEQLKHYSTLSPWDSPWYMGVSIGSLCFALALGISGLSLLMQYRRTWKNLQPPIESPFTPPPILRTAG